MQKGITGWKEYKIVYFANGYQPDIEGVSKELFVLFQHFSQKFCNCVFLHNLSDNLQFEFRRSFLSYPNKLLPIGYPFMKYLESTSDIAHIFGSLTGRIYLKLIKKHPRIITSTSAIITQRIEECAGLWMSMDLIVTESQPDLQTVRQAGVDAEKSLLIYPGIRINPLPQASAESPFTILFASAPIAKNQNSIERRGVMLLIETAKRMPDIRFIFLWRGKHWRKLRQLIIETGVRNIRIFNETIPSMTIFQKIAHCTILTPLESDECKSCPISLVESLAHGRPVLASDKIGIADLIETTQCGIVFPPDPEEAAKGINRLRNDYAKFANNALSVAMKYFSEEKFFSAYEQLYDKLRL